MRLIGYFVACLLIPVSLGADQESARLFFQRGNEAYQKGNFEKAISYYQNALSENYESDALYYNLGNCYFKINRIGHAILYYQKALRLNPDDTDIRFNLDLVTTRRQDRIEVPEPSFIEKVYYHIRDKFNSREWGNLLATTFLFSSTLFAFFLLWPGRRFVRRVALYLLILLVVADIVMMTFYLNRRSYESLDNRGIVVATSSRVLGAPFEKATELFILHEGTEVRVLDEEDKWLKVELPDGKQGWLKKETVGII